MNSNTSGNTHCMRIRGGIGVALPVAGGSSNAVKHAAKDDGKEDMSDKVCWHRVDDIDGDDCYGFLTDVVVFLCQHI